MQNNGRIRLILTGGHAASTAAVVIEEIRKKRKAWGIYWIGPRSSLEGERIPTLSSFFYKYKIATKTIISGRIQRSITLWTIPSLLKIPIGFIHAFFLLYEIKPNIILSFGGFSAFPVVVVGYLMGIPIMIHEQTSVAGRVNILSSFFAKKIAISRETSRPFFPKEKTIITGNPIPEDIVRSKKIKKLPAIPTILVTGGQTGSIVINRVVESILTRLLKNYQIIHLTGLKDEERFQKIKENLPDKLKKNYQVYSIVDPKKFNQLFNLSSILISRAGANTVSKIVFARKPSILIPLPNSYLQEQEKNAAFALEQGVARLIKQNDLTPERLLSEIKFLFKNWSKMATSSKRQSLDKEAAARILRELEKLLL